MVIEVQADTVRSLFGHSGWELTELQPEDIDSAMTVNKAIEEPILWFRRELFLLWHVRLFGHI